MNVAAIAKSPESAASAGMFSLRTFWQKLRAFSVRRARRLRLAEMLSLGDRRFVAVLEFEGMRFLVGGTAASLVLLDRLSGSAAPNSGTSSEPQAHAPEGSR